MKTYLTGILAIVFALLCQTASGSERDLNERLSSASSQGDLSTLTTLLSVGADPNAKDGRGRTPLYMASYNGHTDVVSALLEAGADPSLRSKGGAFPLYAAAEKGHVEIVAILLAGGATPNVQDEWGRTPLDAAVQKARVEGITALLEAGAEPDVPSLTKYLIKLSRKGDASTLTTLFAAGGNPNAQDERGRTPLHWATWDGHSEVIATLLEAGTYLNSRDDQGKTPLHWAAEQGRAEVVEQLLEVGANPAVQDDRGNLPVNVWKGKKNDTYQLLVEATDAANETIKQLLSAVWDGDIATLIVLLANGGNPNAKDHNGNTLLAYASYQGYTELIATLVEAGGDPNVQNVDGYFPLDWAAKQGHPEAITALFPDGIDLADLNARLFSAATHGDVITLRTLLAAGANPNARDTNGYTPLDLAAYRTRGGYGYAETIAALLEGGANVVRNLNLNWYMLGIVENADVATLVTFLEAGADPNGETSYGTRPLYEAVERGLLEVANALLDFGADPNTRNSRGNTLLHVAVVKGHSDIIRSLIMSGANPNVQSTYDGRIPLHWAAKKGDDEGIAMLLESGSDPNISDKSGYTPLRLAIHHGHSKAIATLLKGGAEPMETGLSEYLFDIAKRGDVTTLSRLQNSERFGAAQDYPS